MSIESHLSELERKHRAIDRELEVELQHANSDDMRVTELKRRKLYLKDEIARLRAQNNTLH